MHIFLLLFNNTGDEGIDLQLIACTVADTLDYGQNALSCDPLNHQQNQEQRHFQSSSGCFKQGIGYHFALITLVSLTLQKPLPNCSIHHKMIAPSLIMYGLRLEHHHE